jgi:CBS domain containing-hemolysin-like protein
MDPSSSPQPPGVFDGISGLPGIDILTAAVVFFLCLVGTAFFSSSEAAIITLSKLRVRTLAEQGQAAAQRLQSLIKSRDRLVATILLAENALIIFATTVMAFMIFRAADRGIVSLPPWLQPWSPWLAIAVSAFITTVLVVLIAEVIPKTFATQNAEKYAMLTARPLRWVTRALWLPVLLLNSVAKVYVQLVNVVFGTRQELALPLVTEDELRQLLNDVQQQGGIEQEQTEMIRSVIELRDTSAREIMVPRIDMVCVPADAPFDEALRVAIDEGHSRIPVYQDSSDNIIGLLYSKDLLGVLQGDFRPENIPAELIRPAFHVPESKAVDELLQLMRTEKVHLAIVLDEFGGTAGLVTIEDILEEIVGEIHDEYDAEEQLEIQPQADGTLVVDGRANIDDVSEQLGAKLPTEDFDTIGGFVVGLLGRAPSLGEEVTWDGVRLKIEEVDNRRVARIRIWRRHTSPLDLPSHLADEPHRKGA